MLISEVGGWLVGFVGFVLGLYALYIATGGGTMSNGISVLPVVVILVGGLVIGLAGITVAITSREQRGAGVLTERGTEDDDDEPL